MNVVNIIRTKNGESIKVFKNVWSVDSASVSGDINIWYKEDNGETGHYVFTPNKDTWMDLTMI